MNKRTKIIVLLLLVIFMLVSLFCIFKYPHIELETGEYVYYDPVNEKKCDRATYWTTYNKNTTCYRWIVIKDYKKTVKLVLDHNYVFEDKNEYVKYDNIDSSLKSIGKTWKNKKVSLLSLNEVMDFLEMDEEAAKKLNNDGKVEDTKHDGILGASSFTYDDENDAMIYHKGNWLDSKADDSCYIINADGNIEKTAKNIEKVGLRPVITVLKKKVYNSGGETQKLKFDDKRSDLSLANPLIISASEIGNNFGNSHKRSLVGYSDLKRVYSATPTDLNSSLGTKKGTLSENYASQGFVVTGNKFLIYFAPWGSQAPTVESPRFITLTRGSATSGSFDGGVRSSEINCGHGNDATYNTNLGKYIIADDHLISGETSNGGVRYRSGTSFKNACSSKKSLKINSTKSKISVMNDRFIIPSGRTKSTCQVESGNDIYDYCSRYVTTTDNTENTYGVYLADGKNGKYTFSGKGYKIPANVGRQGLEYHDGYLYSVYYEKRDTTKNVQSTGMVHIINMKLKRDGTKSVSFGKSVSVYYAHFLSNDLMPANHSRQAMEFESVSFPEGTNTMYLLFNAKRLEKNDTNAKPYIYQLSLDSVRSDAGNYYYGTTVKYTDTTTYSEKYYWGEQIDTDYFALGSSHIGWIYSRTGSGATKINPIYKKKNASITTVSSSTKNGITENLSTVKITSSKYSNIGTLATNGGTITVSDTDIGTFLKQFTCTRCTVVAVEDSTEKTSGNFVNGKTYKLRIKASDTNKTTIKDINLTPTIKEYSITYNLNGGTVGWNPTIYKTDTATFTLNNPVKPGYTFTGWTGSNGTTPQTSVTIAKGSNGNKTYTANWKANDLYIIYHMNGGSLSSNHGSAIGTSGNVITIDGTTAVKAGSYGGKLGTEGLANYNNPNYINIERKGYTVTSGSEWNAKADGTGTSYDQATQYNTSDFADLTNNDQTIYLYVNWKIVNYGITYNLGGGVATNPTTYNVDTNTFTLNNPTKTGYRFTGWTGSNGTTPSTNVTIAKGSTGNREYTANYAREDYNITYNLNGGEVIGNPTTYNIDTGTFTLKNPTKEGATFKGWTGSNGTTPQTTVTITKGSSGNRNYTANWENNRYTVTFNTNGGNSISSQEVEHKGKVMRPADPAKDGYNFSGWYSNSALTEVYDFNSVVTKNITLYAGWQAKEYTITFNSNGGSTVNAITKKYGESIEAPSNPVREGYKFAGWYIDEGLTALYTFDKMGKENITLYAKWTADENVISYVLDGGINNGQNPTTYLTGEEKTLYDAEKAGYEFIGWYSDNSYTNKIESITSDMTGDITLYAKFEAKEYTITFNSNGGSTVNPITKKYKEDVTEPEKPTKEGYEFKGWYSDSGLTEKYTFSKMPKENITLYAKWISNIVTVSFNTNGGNTLSDIRIERGESLTSLPTAEKVGHSFLGWYKNSTLTEKYNGEKVEEDTTLYAKWKINKYTVRFINEGEIIKEDTKEYGEKVDEIEKPSKKGYEFKGWYKDSIGATPYDFEEDVTSDIDLYAVYEAKEYTITFDSNGGSIINPITKHYNETVEDPEEPTKAGYRFAGWYSDEDLTSLYTFTTMPDKNITLYAKWISNEYLIRYELDGGENNENNPTSYKIGEEKRLYDAEKKGYNFLGWYKEPTYENKIESITEDMEEDLTLYAKWEVKKHLVLFKTDEEEIEQMVVDGETASIPELEKEGHTLNGWYKDKDLSIRYNGEKVEEDTTLYGKWIRNTYTINFNTNGGSPINSISGLYEEEAIRPNDPVKEGYQFAGWYSDEGLTELYSFTMYKEDITLYAKWAKNDDNTIDYDPEGGENDPSNPTIIDPDNPTPIKPAEKEGSEFIRWETEDGRVITDTSQLKGNEKLYAVYKDGRLLWIPDTASFITITGIALGTMLIGTGTYLVYRRYKEYRK